MKNISEMSMEEWSENEGMLDKYEDFAQKTEAVDYPIEEELIAIEDYLKENK